MDQRREILAIIAEKKKQAERLIEEARQLADKYGIGEGTAKQDIAWEQSDESDFYQWEDSSCSWDEDWNSSDC